MKRNEWKKYVLALALAVILCMPFLSARAASAEESVLPGVLEFLTRLLNIQDVFLNNNSQPSEESQEKDGWKGGDPSCEHLNISWVSDGSLRHHAVCDDCGAEGPERAHTTEYRPTAFSHHTLECNLCGKQLKDEPHTFVYQSNGQSGHAAICLSCGFAISADHSLVCVNDGDASHHWECVVCGAITATASHRLLPRNVGNERHCYACKDCTYFSDAVPCSYTATSQGKAGHVLTCVVCSATTGNVEPHHLTWVSEGLTGHHEECLDCGYATQKILHDWVAVSRGLQGHGLECPTCGEVTAQIESHDWVAVSRGLQGHGLECPTCGEVTAQIEPHTWVGVSKGPRNHVAHCSVCGETTGQTEAHYWYAVPKGTTGHTLQCVVCGEGSDQILPHDWYMVNEGAAGHRGVCKTCEFTTQLLPHMMRSTADGVSCACGYKESKPSKPDQGNEPVQVEIPGPGKSEESGGVVAEKPEGQQEQTDKTDNDTQIQQLEEKFKNYSEKENEIKNRVEEILRQRDNREISLDESYAKLDRLGALDEVARKVIDDVFSMRRLQDAKQSDSGVVVEIPEGQQDQNTTGTGMPGGAKKADQGGAVPVSEVEIPGPGKTEETGGMVAEKPEGQQEQTGGEAQNIEKGDQEIPDATWSYSKKKITKNGKTYQVSVRVEKQDDKGSAGGSVEQTSTRKNRKKRLNTPKTISIHDVPSIPIGGSVAEKSNGGSSKTTESNIHQVIFSTPIGGNTIYLQDNRGSGR